MGRYSRELGKEVTTVAPETMERLRRYTWPGNVRELQSVLKQALLQAAGPILLPEFLPPLHRAADVVDGRRVRLWTWSDTSTRGLRQGAEDLYAEAVRRLERILLPRVLRHTDGNQLRRLRYSASHAAACERNCGNWGCELTVQSFSPSAIRFACPVVARSRNRSATIGAPDAPHWSFSMKSFWPCAALAVLCLAPWRGRRPPKPDAKSFEVPYRLTAVKHIVVRAKINGKGPFNFILDTGTPALFIAPEAAKKAGVEPDAKGWGVFDSFEIEGGVVLTKAKGRIEKPFQLDGMNGLGLAGVELHGMIGYNILAHYRMKIDFTKDKMVWTPLELQAG